MKILVQEQGDAFDVQRLERAWEEPETFVFLPEKRSATEAWIRAAWAQAPAHMQEGHFLLLTSGSTGQPKLIVGARHRAEALARLLHTLQDSEPVSETVIALPLTYCYSFVNQWLWARLHQRVAIHTQGFSRPDQLKNALSQAQNGMLCLVGAQVPLLERYMQTDSFPGIIRLHFAGGRFPQEKLERIAQWFPNAQIFNNYGCAEAMPRLTIRRAEDADDASHIGSPLPGIKLRLNDDQELLFQSPYSAVAAIDDDGFHAFTEESWIKTGDIGEQNPDGTWRLTGRANEVFKRHGEKLSLAILLSTVRSVWSGQAGFYRERDAHGEEGAVLVLAPPASDAQIRQILRAFRATHPRTHWPLRIESTAQLPMLANGKVDQHKLSNLNEKTVHWYQRL